MSRKKKILIGAGVFLLVAILMIRAVTAGSGNAVDVRTEDVERRDLVATVSATGHIEPKTSVDISADVSGRIVELTVAEGDDVDEGQLLLVIDDARFQASLQRSEASLADAMRGRRRRERAPTRQLATGSAFVT